MKIEEWLTGDIKYDSLGQFITCNNGKNRICDIRGWGAISHKFKDMEEADKFQDSVGEFIVLAIKEKLQKIQDEKRSVFVHN